MGVNSHTSWKFLQWFICINISYILSGILYEKISKNSYHNNENNHYDLFRSSIGYCVVLHLVSWLLAEIYCLKILKKEEYVVIETKKSFICGSIIAVSSVSFMEAMYLLSYPFIMMAKSNSVLQLLLVGIFCIQVKNHNEKLGKDKIINSFAVTFGFMIFKVFDPETSFKTQTARHFEVLGLLLLLINQCADCFLPDFEAEIEQKFKPKPEQMLAETSKWSFIICFACSIFTGDLTYTLNFMLKHPTFSFEILALAILSFLGQTFVDRMIKNFQQHIIPLIKSTRKTFTIAFNLVYFGHRTSFAQILGIFIAFSATVWQFAYTLNEKEEKTRAKNELKLCSEVEIQPPVEINSILTQGRKNNSKKQMNDKYQLNSLNNQTQQEEQVLRSDQ